MIFQLYDNSVRLKLETGEDIGILKDLQQYFSYNDTDYRYQLLQEARGQAVGIDYEDLDQVRELSYMAVDPSYQNYLCYVYNSVAGGNKFHNYIRKTTFLKTEMNNGYRTVLRVDYVKRTTVFLPGLLRLAIVFLQDHVEEDYGIEWELKVEDKRVAQIHLTPEPVYEYNGIALYPEQREAVDMIRTTLTDHDNYGYLFSRVMLDLSVNFGKTFSLYILSKNFTLKDGSQAPVIWFYSDRELLSKAIADYIQLEGENLSVLAADQSYVKKYLWARGIKKPPVFDQRKPFTLAMEQTLDSRLKSKKLGTNYLKYWNIGIYDECQKAGNDRANRVLSRFRFGGVLAASGSPTSSMSGASRYGVTGQFGSIRYSVDFKDTVDMGKSLPLQVRRLYNPISVRYPTNSYNIGRVKKSGVYESEQRYQLLKYAVLESIKEGRQTLIYGGSLQLKYLENWYERLKADGVQLDFTSGDDPERIAKVSAFSKLEISILMSNKILGTGIDISSIGAVIYLNPTDNEIDVMQAPIGRLGRIFKGMDVVFKEGVIWDFYDDDTYYDVDLQVSLLDFGESPDVGTKTVPGELTRISDIRAVYYKRQNIPIVDVNPLDL